MNTSTSITLRPVTSTDLDAITSVYRHHVLHGSGSFEESAPSVTEITERCNKLIDSGYPYWVAEIDGDLAGFAYAGPHKARSAYRFTVEDSIYISPAHGRRKVGFHLLSKLIDECRSAGFRQMMAVIGDSNNAGSIGLHERLGFSRIGIARGIGFKHERWLDIVYMQLDLAE
jgi:phosphinothricin acetyltransferase